jgi:allophanate hydrolase
MTTSLTLRNLKALYSAGTRPVSVVESIYDEIERDGISPVWISLVPREDALAQASALEAVDPASLKLYGIPFAVKDNIDVAGMTTTAGCPEFAYVAEVSAQAVDNLQREGAILIGKTNLDQFATGLVGVRTPYGICSSVFNPQYISGGSSSGSAVAVAMGLVSFALGTDTAGSGRVPAAFNNIVGLKPTKNLISTFGVVPACQSLDCVSIFTLTAEDAKEILNCAIDSDTIIRQVGSPWLASTFRFGTPADEFLEFFGDDEARGLYSASIAELDAMGGRRVVIDYCPFKEAAALLYSGPWVAERLAAVGGFMDEKEESMDPVVRGIIAGARKYTAVDLFNAEYRLDEIRAVSEREWQKMDILLLPTTGTTYTISDVQADPIRLNSNLGYYTNFVNLLNLAAIAVPAGFRSNGLPFGVTFIGTAGTDLALIELAKRYESRSGRMLGRSSLPLELSDAEEGLISPPGCTLVAVVGAHLTGQPLNHQLTSRRARLVISTRSAPGYKLFALPNTQPPKPGLVRAPGFEGPGIELEIWSIPTTEFGSFVTEIPPPLGIGSVELANGQFVKGFICEEFGSRGAVDITSLGGWRNYLSSIGKASTA